MATKASPGRYDCWSTLEPDEPYFLLKSTDPTAPKLVCAWAALRRGDLGKAKELLTEAFADLLASGKPIFPADSPKSIEAVECATAMANWALSRRLKKE